ncbi:hypothetical protein V2W45_1473135 [Cenococcum geophilum]
MPNIYTRTAYPHGNAVYDGLKSKLPNPALSPPSSYPSGTETVFAGSLYPMSEVPDGVNSLYNCTLPSGFFNLRAPDAPVGSEGGMRGCPNQYNANVTSLYAVTPHSNRTDCVELTGLGTYNYTGHQPVWADY